MTARQSASQPYVPRQSDRPEPIEGDEAGFQSIFDGKTLDGWEGDPAYWRVSDGIMTGEITPDTIIKSNTFIIWQGASPEEFELKVDCRITGAGNSGINYRSVVVPDKRNLSTTLRHLPALISEFCLPPAGRVWAG